MFIENVSEEYVVCLTTFTDVYQVFDEVWHKVLRYKPKRDLLKQFYLILGSYGKMLNIMQHRSRGR